ncbi:hypothetical protein [Nocardia cyriacigeorgica]|uniref:hypothetical protein n=1 Tax=Nocardia cyriacigeorgica TaxID=135487 RepID=UPI001895E8BF|nr:hypothetical protein [Nocardia cyriacigeorgica]MBF6416201.1 hypothetical protein [Nocardia cyriacigeorgica]
MSRTLGRPVALAIGFAAATTILGGVIAAPANADRGDAAYYCALNHGDYESFRKCVNDNEDRIHREDPDSEY